MKLTLPLNYTAFYKLPKMSGWSKQTMRTEFTGLIREVERNEVEIAFRIGETRLEQSLPQSFVKTQKTAEQKAYYNHPFRCEDNPIDVIYFDGAFYAERFPADNAEAEFKAPAIGKDAFSAVGSSPLYGLAKFPHPEAAMEEQQRFGWYEQDAPETKADVETKLGINEVKRWTPLETDAIKLAEQVFDTFIIVEDTVYERVGEPTLKVFDTGGDINLAIDEITPMPRLNDKPQRGEVGTYLRYGIDQIEEARAAGRLLASATGRKFVDYVKFDEVNPAFVTFRGEAENLYNYAMSTYRHFTSSDGIGSTASYAFDHLGREAILAIHDFGRAMEANETITPEIVRAARVIVAIYKAANGKWDVYNKDAFEHYWYDAAEKLYCQFEEFARGLDQRLALYDRKIDDQLDWNRLGLDATPYFSETERCYQITNLIEARKMAQVLQVDVDNYVTQAADGSGHLLAIEDFMTKRIVAAAYFPQDERQAAKIWVPSFSQRKAEFESMFENFLANANVSTKQFTDELESLGL